MTISEESSDDSFPTSPAGRRGGRRAGRRPKPGAAGRRQQRQRPRDGLERKFRLGLVRLTRNAFRGNARREKRRSLVTVDREEMTPRLNPGLARGRPGGAEEHGECHTHVAHEAARLDARARLLKKRLLKTTFSLKKNVHRFASLVVRTGTKQRKRTAGLVFRAVRRVVFRALTSTIVIRARRRVSPRARVEDGLHEPPQSRTTRTAGDTASRSGRRPRRPEPRRKRL